MKTRMCHLRRTLTAIALLVFTLAARGAVASAAPWDASPGGAPAAPEASTTLVINEVDYLQPNTDDREFVELLNVSNRGVNLRDYAVLGIDSQGAEYRRDRLPIKLLAPGEHFVLGSALVDNVDLVVGSVDIWTDGDANDGQPAAVALVFNTGSDPANDVLVDSVSYDGTVAGGPNPNQTWVEGDVGVDPGDPNDREDESISRFPDGYDSDENALDFTARCSTPGYPNSTENGNLSACAPPATRTPSPTPDRGPQGFVINEIDYQQVGQADFVEILNAGQVARSLIGYSVLGLDGRSGATTEYRRDVLPRVILQPGARFVLGNSTVPGVNLDLGASDLWISGSSDGPMGVALVYNTGTDPVDDRLVDSLSYEGDLLGGPDRGGSWTETLGVTATDDPGVAYQGLSRNPDGSDNDFNRLDFGLHCITPGYANTTDSDPCSPPATPTVTATATDTATPPDTATPTATATASATGTATPTATGTATPTATDGPSPTPRPTALPGHFTVDSNADDDDVRPGDGVCATRLGDCTLRAALREAQMATGQDAIVIDFVGPMEIDVPDGRPLSALDHHGTTLTGAAHFRGGAPGVRIVGPRRVTVRGTLARTEKGALLPETAAPDQSSEAALVGLVLGGDTVVQGLDVTGFDVGIRIRSDARDTTIGDNGDGFMDEREGVVVENNVQHGIEVVEQVSLVKETRHRLAGNMVRYNGGHGVLLWGTKRPQNVLTMNRIYDNGGAAIGLLPGADELKPPSVLGFEPSRGIAGGMACPRCVVEVFGDAADEAQVYLGTATADNVGLWQAAGLDAAGVAQLTATARDAQGNTSRLSRPLPAGTPWNIIDVTGMHPRLIYPNLTFRRVLRVLDESLRPVAGAVLHFERLGLDVTADNDGFAELDLLLPAFLDPGQSRGLSLGQLESGGTTHPPLWAPTFVLGRAKPVLPTGTADLLLEGLGPLGLGLHLTGPVHTTVALSSTELDRAAAMGADGAELVAASPEQTAEVYGAGMLVSPADLREGPTSWHEDLAKGGAFYEVRAPAGGASGTLTITAPTEAYNRGGPATGCQGGPDGSSIAGWNREKICWVPIVTSVAQEPGPDDASFDVTAEVDVPGGTTLSTLQATGVYTLYTVGYDVTSPTITPMLGDTTAEMLPEVVAVAHDLEAGVDAQSVRVTLDGAPLSAAYDAATGEIRLEPASRQRPAGGAGILVVQVTDGYCNQTQGTFDLEHLGGVVYLPTVRTTPH